jgi:Fe-S-cluster containining protein
MADLERLRQEILTWNEVYTLRAGEKVTSREGEVTHLPEERLKVREVPGTRQCWFYLAATNACRIYDDRPEQCRRQHCWGEPEDAPEPEAFLSRRHLLQVLPEIWEIVSAHEERCALADVARAVTGLAEGREEAGDPLFEALHFDHYLRQMLLQDWGLSTAAIELLLGRPLSEFLRDQGLTATLTPDGVFHLAPR